MVGCATIAAMHNVYPSVYLNHSNISNEEYEKMFQIKIV